MVGLMARSPSADLRWQAAYEIEERNRSRGRRRPLGTQLAPLAPLAPHLRRHLAEYPTRHEANSEIARLLWQLDHDLDEVLPVLRPALSISPQSAYDYTRHPPPAAIRAAAELGEHAGPLVDLIRVALRNPLAWLRVVAAEALARLGAADPDELIPAILPDPERCTQWLWVAAEPALDLLAELQTVPAAPRLTGWLTTDQRVQANVDDTVRIDERFQARVRQLLADLNPG